MNKIIYETRCQCNEEFSKTKKRKSLPKSEGKPMQYPKSHEIKSKTFKIKYQKNLPLMAKIILNSFQNKYIYYAIDDILYSLKLTTNERDSLLSVLYSPLISLQNNFSVNFLDIWIQEIYIDEIPKTNRFINNELKFSKEFSLIIIKFFYKTKVPAKQQESLW